MWELQFEIETKCSLNCVHCSSFEMRQHKNRYYTDDDLINFIKLFETSLHIYFTGGEPINYLLFGSEHKGRLNGIIPEAICGDIMSFVCGLAVASLVLYALHCLGAFDKIGQWKKNRKSRKH